MAPSSTGYGIDDHAAVANLVKGGLEEKGWLVEAEVSFSRYGERGRIDLLAFHPIARILLVIEIKTVVADIQQLLGGLDVKARLAPAVAATRGWRGAAIVPCVVLVDGSTAAAGTRACLALREVRAARSGGNGVARGADGAPHRSAAVRELATSQPTQR